MTTRRLLVSAVILVALVVQTTVVARLPLPGAAPDLVLLVVLAVALHRGPSAGMVAGFGAGLLADLLADHEVGRLAVAYVLVGYLVGLARDEPVDRAVLLPLVVLGSGAATGVLVYAAEGWLLGDPRSGIGPLFGALTSAVPYDLLLALPVLAVVGRSVGRLGSRAERGSALGAVRGSTLGPLRW